MQEIFPKSLMLIRRSHSICYKQLWDSLIIWDIIIAYQSIHVLQFYLDGACSSHLHQQSRLWKTQKAKKLSGWSELNITFFPIAFVEIGDKGMSLHSPLDFSVYSERGAKHNVLHAPECAVQAAPPFRSQVCACILLPWPTKSPKERGC